MAVAEKVRELKPKVERLVPADIVTITPQMAEDLLGKNTRNRNVSKVLVEAYARDMASNSWQFTGEAIKLSKDGKLIDGQHRLLACIKSQTLFTTLIVYDLEPTAQDVLDTGRGRTFADVLALKGTTHANRTAAACRWLIAIKNGYRMSKVSHSEQLDIFRRHDAINDSVHVVEGAYGISQSLLAAIHYIGARLIDKEPFASEFVSVFITGNSYDNCAAHSWRERIIRMKASQNRIGTSNMMIGSIHAWNLFSGGKEVKLFRIPESAKIDGLDLDLI